METKENKREAVALGLMARLNNCRYLQLLERCGGMDGFFRERREAVDALGRGYGLVSLGAEREKALQETAGELRLLERHGIRCCPVEGEAYPRLLRECEDAPMVLFYKGAAPEGNDAEKRLAIVGTRKASTRCQERVASLLEELYGMGHRPVVASGLAYGIDAAAHRGALRNGLRTVAVLGHGLHMVYPAAHKALAENITEAGGTLLSEYPCGAATVPANFLKRNRIIAGISHATLVAESAVKGGALSTARAALEYNREVMAFPGRPEDTYSAGCNLLIKENVAALVENGTDVARLLGYPERKAQAQQQQQLELDFFGGQGQGQGQTLLSLLESEGEMHVDELQARTGIGAGELPALLLQLELEGKIISIAGQRYAKK